MPDSPEQRLLALEARIAALEGRVLSAVEELQGLREQAAGLARAIRRHDPQPPLRAEPPPPDTPPRGEDAPPVVSPVTEKPRQPTAAAPDRVPPPPVVATPPPPPPEAREDLETRIGADLMLRVGLAAVVIAFAMLAYYAHDRLQPWHKVALGYFAAAALLGVGIFLEKRLRTFARPVAAGGLALAFFISYAAHFVALMKCVSLATSAVLMFVSIAALVFTAEKWRSQPTAGLAILLGHVAAFVAAGHSGASTLVAVVVLSITSVALQLRHAWPPLGFLAILAAHLSHLLWMLRDHPVSTPQTTFWVNFGFLSSYFAIFLTADLVQRQQIWRGRVCLTSRRQVLASRSSGPSALMLYLTFSLAIFAYTEVYWDRLYLFLFPLALLIAAVFVFQDRRENPDSPFYGAASVLLATLGLFSWLDGLALNLALAVQALLLMILARRMRLWFLGPLAQAVLGINFLHYWVSSAHDSVTWPAYLGGVATGWIYLLKARLGETWSSLAIREPLPEHPWAQGLRDFFDRWVPRWAWLNAVAGGLLLSYQCGRFFGDPWESTACAVLTLAAMGAALFLHSPRLALAAWTLQAGTLLLAVGHLGRTRDGIDFWTADSLALVLIVVAGWSACIFGRTRRRGWPLAVGTGTLLLTVPLACTVAGLREPHAGWVPLWALAPLALWLESEWLGLTGMRDEFTISAGPSEKLERHFLDHTTLWRGLLVAGGAFLFVFVSGSVLSREGALWLLTLTVPALLGLVLWRDSPNLLLGSSIHLWLTLLLWLPRFESRVFHGESPDPLAPGLGRITWLLALAALGGAAVLAVRGRAIRRASFVWGALSALAAGLLLLLATSAITRQDFSPFPLWLLPLAAVWVTTEALAGIPRATAANWRDRLGLRGLWRAALPSSVAFSLLGASVLAAVTHIRFSPDDARVCAVTTVFALIFLLLAGGIRGLSLASAYALLLSYGYFVFFRDLGLTRGAIEHPFVGGFIAAVGLLAGGAIERAYRASRSSTTRAREWLILGSWHGYLPALLIATWLFYEQAARLTGGEPWGWTAQTLLALLLFAAGAAVRLPWLQLAASALSFWAVLGLFARNPFSNAETSLVFAGCVLAALLIATERVARHQPDEILDTIAAGVERVLRIVFIAAAAAGSLFVLAVSPQVKASWTTVGWSLTGFTLMVLGFLWKERLYRLTGLVVFALSLGRLVIVDVARLELFYRILAFLCVGLCLIVVSLLYSRYRRKIHEWL